MAVLVGSSGYELLATIDVVRRASESSVGHDVHGEGRDVGRTHDAADR